MRKQKGEVFLAFLVMTMLTVGTALVATDIERNKIPLPTACEVVNVKAANGDYNYRRVVDTKGCVFTG